MAATAVAEEMGLSYETVLYLKDKPDRAEITRLVEMIEDPVEDLVRKDSKFKQLGLDPGDYIGNKKAVIDLLVHHTALLQRPIVVRGKKAIVGRPRERVAPFLKPRSR